jgi:catechol 2,3-dioxygenase
MFVRRRLRWQSLKRSQLEYLVFWICREIAGDLVGEYAHALPSGFSVAVPPYSAAQAKIALRRRTLMNTSGAFLAGDPGVSTPGAISKTGVTSAGAPLRVGTVALTVRDLDTVNRFYQEVIGLTPIETQGGLVRLGAGATVLLELRHDPAAPLANPRSAGLFHTAFLLPTRADLGQWLLHAADLRVRLQGASDHLVSEAIYLADPEGNGIEVYRDRPSETWALRDGTVQMDTLRLDLDDLAAAANKSRWSGLPEGSCIGHVHLQVGALEPAERFYAGLLGFEVTCRYPGATFFGSGGYHHHIGTNIWNSAGAPLRQPGAAGIASVEIIPANREISTALAQRVQALPSVEAAGGLGVQDPWGTNLVLRAI